MTTAKAETTNEPPSPSHLDQGPGMTPAGMAAYAKHPG